VQKLLFNKSNNSEANYHFPSDNHSVSLDSCVEIIMEQTAAKEIIFQGVYFHLNPEYLSKISRAKYHNFDLKISEELLDEFRDYVLENKSDPLNSGLSFTSFYEENRKKGVFRSLIYLDGTVFQQVQQEALQDSDLVIDITKAHVWLVEQLLRKVQIIPQPSEAITEVATNRKSNKWLSWILAIVIYLVILAIVLIITQFKVDSLLILISAIMIVPLRWLIKSFLK
jgi:hypothetical protein